MCMNYSLFVNEDTYDKYCKELTNYAHSAVVSQKTLPSFGDVYASEPEPMHQPLQRQQQQEHPEQQEPMSYSSPQSQDYFMQNQQQHQRPIPHSVSPEPVSSQRYGHASFPAAPPVSWTYSYPTGGEPAGAFAGNGFGNHLHAHSQFMQMPMHAQHMQEPAISAGSDSVMFMMPAGPPFFHQPSYPFGAPQYPYAGVPGPAMYAQPAFYVPVGSR